MKRALLYIIGFPNGKLYVGITTEAVQRRFRRHCRSCERVGQAIRKYGPENCRLMVLRRNLFWKEAGNLECWYIQELEARIGQGGYNVTAGGDGSLGTRPSTETKHRIRVALQGQPKSTAHRQRLSESLRGRSRSAEARQSLSRTLRGKPLTGKRLAAARVNAKKATAASAKARRKQ